MSHVSPAVLAAAIGLVDKAKVNNRGKANVVKEVHLPASVDRAKVAAAMATVDSRVANNDHSNNEAIALPPRAQSGLHVKVMVAIATGTTVLHSNARNARAPIVRNRNAGTTLHNLTTLK